MRLKFTWLAAALLLLFVADLNVAVGDIVMPFPRRVVDEPKPMTLDDAILLSMRNNPGVRSARLDRVVQKFALAVAFNKFEPQYKLEGSATYAPGSAPNYSLTPSVSLTTPLGTTFDITSNNSFGDGHSSSATFTVDQPLLRGFGPDINLISLHNQEDTELTNRLGFQNTLMSTIKTIISDYYTLVQDYQNLRIDKENLKESSEELAHTELQIKLGKFPQSEAIQQRQSIASQHLSLVQQKNTLNQDYQTLLTNLGLDPDAQVKIVGKITLHYIKIPSLERSLQLALEHNTTYQTDVINMRATKRALLSAEDDMRPKLDMTATATQGISNSGALAGGASSKSVGLSLSVPIDDMTRKQALIGAKINLQKAKIALAESRRQLRTNVINSLNTLKATKRQIAIAEQSVVYARKTLQNDKLRLKYGKVSSFQLVTDRDTLISAEQSLVSNRVAYINAFTEFEETLGVLLDQWGIHVHY